MLFYVLNELKYLIQVLSIIYSLKSAESGNTIWPVKARDHASSRSIIFCRSCMWWSNWQKPQKQITVWRFYKMKTWDGIYYQIQSKETKWNCKKMMDKQLELAVTRCLSLMLCWAISRTQTHTIYVVRQLAYSTELLVCINEAYKQYKQRGGESSQLNSTLKLSLLFSVLSSLCVFTLCNSSVLLLCVLSIHMQKTSRGGTLIYN
jgi:hypothetical protein